MYRRGFTGAVPVADLGGGDHSSRPAVTRRLKHPTRSLGMASVESGTAPLRSRLGSSVLSIHRDGSPLAAYLGLLAVGFTLPRPSPVARCALTAPFHPYRRKRQKVEKSKHVCSDVFSFRRLRGGVFSVALSLGSRRVGVTNHRALPSSDFPPAGLRTQASNTCKQAPAGDRLRPLHL